ncbi:hypothetical protein LCGC14_1715710 [marine sediment metagenome]|uniref:Uncharacterized protein n=1 Tax=marine sediment metagenome TaxID=412755 RepID=A0A0F9JUC1_9ZZZZ
MEAEVLSRLHELAAMPAEHMLGWAILIFGMPVAGWLGRMLGR